MPTVFVTGATGLIGARVTGMLLDRGYQVRALVRKPSSPDGQHLQELGAELVQGDISDRDSVAAALPGSDALIHSAAMLGGPDQSLELGVQVNALGTMYVLAEAAKAGISPIVQLTTTTFFDMWEHSLTETSPLDLLAANTDPYSLTKRMAFLEGMGRIAAGQDIRMVVPGGVFGPSVCVERAMILPSMNASIPAAARGEVTRIVPLPVPWVYVDDVAAVTVAALEKGRAGERYLGFGRPEDVGTFAFFLNRALELMGSAHRVDEIPKDQLDDPDVIEQFGESWANLGKTNFPDPWFDSSFTLERLGHHPVPLDDGLEQTISWMRREGLLTT
jgi:nucleoside-diphosphate-sugar epimerase